MPVSSRTLVHVHAIRSCGFSREGVCQLGCGGLLDGVASGKWAAAVMGRWEGFWGPNEQNACHTTSASLELLFGPLEISSLPQLLTVLLTLASPQSPCYISC